MATQDNTITQDPQPEVTHRHRGVTTIEVVAVESGNIDTVCYRGSAPIADLAAISQADVFDQVSNPNGLQRDLSPKHASDAYNYLNREKDEEFPRAFPEVILNVRDEDVVSVEPINTGRQKRVKGFRFTFDLDAILDQVDAGGIAVSRVDGNHRLFYAGGNGRREPQREIIPFQLHVGLSPEQEANLFVDVNANQKGLNSSHLHILRSRLTPEEQEIQQHPERVFARRLSEDEDSPWTGMIYMGGSRKGSREAGEDRPVSFVTLEQGVRRTLSKSQYIHDLTLPDAQYILLRNYWQAVASTFSEEWESYKDYLLIKNVGVLGFSLAGGTIIDRCMARGDVTVEAMRAYTDQLVGVFDWSKDARGEKSVAGMSGNRAALLIAGELVAGLVDPGESRAVATLQESLLAFDKAAHAAAQQEAEDDGEWRERPDTSDLEEAGVQRSVT
jgi:DGQHR domain-containing protein